MLTPHANNTQTLTPRYRVTPPRHRRTQVDFIADVTEKIDTGVLKSEHVDDMMVAASKLQEQREASSQPAL